MNSIKSKPKNWQVVGETASPAERSLLCRVHLAAARQYRHHDRHFPDGGSSFQNTQNRDSKAVHLKLDELIRSIDSARNHLVNVDRLSDDELKKLEAQFKRISNKADERSTGSRT